VEKHSEGIANKPGKLVFRTKPKEREAISSIMKYIIIMTKEKMNTSNVTLTSSALLRK
jgi:hypothetical protein